MTYDPKKFWFASRFGFKNIVRSENETLKKIHQAVYVMTQILAQRIQERIAEFGNELANWVSEKEDDDLGGRLEERIAEFGNELANWVSEKEDDGREKCLMFHCFSNRRSLEQLPP
ncbi:hypothetical protein YC2023_081591 [Brassica napus]